VNEHNNKPIFISSILTLVVWNNTVYSRIINFMLPGDLAHQSMLSNKNQISMFIFMIIIFAFSFVVPAILIFSSIFYIRKCSAIPDVKLNHKIWYYVIILLNVLYYVLLGLWFSMGDTMFIPDIGQHILGIY